MNQNEKVNEQNENATIYNEALAEYNDAVNELNAFIQYRNNQFSPKQSDEDIQKMITIPDNKIAETKAKLKSIKHPDASNAKLIISFGKSIDDVKTHLDEQQEFLNNYFSKGSIGRKSMFRKYTWMGIPLN